MTSLTNKNSAVDNGCTLPNPPLSFTKAASTVRPPDVTGLKSFEQNGLPKNWTKSNVTIASTPNTRVISLKKPVVGVSSPTKREHFSEHPIMAQISDSEMLQYGFPPWSVSSVLFDLYYHYVHPQLRLVSPKEKFLACFTPRNNTALVHTMFLCSTPYLNQNLLASEFDKKYAYPAEYYLQMIETYWNQLTEFQTIQNLVLLCHYHLQNNSGQETVAKLVNIVIDLVACSNMAAVFRGGHNFSQFIRYFTKTAIVEKESGLRTLWNVFLILQLSRIKFDDPCLAKDTLTDVGIPQDENLEDVLLPKGLPLPVSDLEYELHLRINELNSKDGFIFHYPLSLKDMFADFKAEVVSSGAHIFAAAEFHRLFNSQSDKNPQLVTQLRQLEEGINRRLYSLHDNDRLLLLDFSAIHAKILTMLLDFKMMQSNLKAIPFDLFVSLDGGQVNLPAPSNVPRIVDTFVYNLNDSSIVEVLKLSLLVMDTINLLTLPSGIVPNTPGGERLISFVIAGPLLDNPTSKACTDDYLLPKAKNYEWWGSSYANKQAHYNESIGSLSSESKIAECKEHFKKLQTLEIWLQYPAVIVKLLEFILPILGEAILVNKYSKFVKTRNSIKLVYRNNEVLPIDFNKIDVQKLLISTGQSSVFYAGCLKTPDLTAEVIWEQFFKFSNIDYLRDKLIICADFMKQRASVLKNGQAIINSVEEFVKFITEIIELPVDS